MNRFDDHTFSSSSVVAISPGPVGSCSAGGAASTAIGALTRTGAGAVSSEGRSRLNHAIPIPTTIAAAIVTVSHFGGICISDNLNFEDPVLPPDPVVGTPGIFG